LAPARISARGSLAAVYKVLEASAFFPSSIFAKAEIQRRSHARAATPPHSLWIASSQGASR
jgi:hypothetical protein